ncbi:MAG TPA: type 2 isopentenyl-diphosphate Delta-isomerase [Candidatus Thermoplasmatota archaeon]|nr:type 2 isopentenyl-diphosphate Delta-isomerase [Candidatus Thermoplasmatota archaeon]
MAKTTRRRKARSSGKAAAPKDYATAKATINRKEEHVLINVKDDVASRHDFFRDLTLVHEALPEVDHADVDLSLTFLGKRLGAPIMIASMTGGYPDAERINRNLAYAASQHGLALGVGSQRAALKSPEMRRTYTSVRDHDVPFVAANIGAPQLLEQKDGKPLSRDDVQSLVSMLEADALIVHLNYLQEVVQPGGDLAARGAIGAIARLREWVDVPLIAKETGAGLTRRTAALLSRAGVAAIDVGGLSGTTFAAVELVRARREGEEKLARLGELYRDWGVPTPVAVLEAGRTGLPVVATGGVKDGLCAAKALALGATMAGMAGAALRAAVKGEKEGAAFLQTVLDELRTALFLTGTAKLSDAARIPVVAAGPTADWLQAFGYDPAALSAGRLDA